jgi:hypothetical protein
VPPLVHGLGGLSGAIATHDAHDLVVGGAAARAAADALGAADVLLPRANGAVCTGSDLPTACVRAFFLEERARVAHDAGPHAIPLSDAEILTRARHHPTETARAWRWLVWRHPGADRSDPTPEGGGT